MWYVKSWSANTDETKFYGRFKTKKHAERWIQGFGRFYFISMSAVYSKHDPDELIVLFD